MLRHIQNTCKAHITAEFDAIRSTCIALGVTDISGGPISIISQFAANQYNVLLIPPFEWSMFDLYMCLDYLIQPFEKNGVIHGSSVLIQYMKRKDYDIGDILGDMYTCPTLMELHGKVETRANKVFTNLFFYNMHFKNQ